MPPSAKSSEPTVLSVPVGQTDQLLRKAAASAKLFDGSTSAPVCASTIRRSRRTSFAGSLPKRKCSVPLPATSLSSVKSKACATHFSVTGMRPLFSEPQKKRGGIGMPLTQICGPPSLFFTRTASGLAEPEKRLKLPQGSVAEIACSAVLSMIVSALRDKTKRCAPGAKGNARWVMPACAITFVTVVPLRKVSCAGAVRKSETNTSSVRRAAPRGNFPDTARSFGWVRNA